MAEGITRDAGMTQGGIMAILPALVLAVAGLLALCVYSLTRDGIEGQFLVVMSPLLAPTQILDRVHAAGGGVVGMTALPGMVVAISDKAGFREAMRARGAMLVMPASGRLGCVAPRQEGIR